MSIPLVGSGRSGNRPSGRVSSESGIDLDCVPRVGKLLEKFQVTDLVGKNSHYKGFRAC